MSSLYKICAQLVHENQENPVHDHPHNPHSPALAQYTDGFTRTFHRQQDIALAGKPHVLHTAFTRSNRGHKWLYAFSTSSIITIFKYI